MSGRPQPGDPDFPYMLADTSEEFERVRRAAWRAAWPAPSPAAAGLPLEDVERVEVNNGCMWCGSHCQCGAGITYEDAPVPPDANGGEER